ncbi:hypothetical protein DDE82_008717 [Stemphylium lycopersici]|nr:hypothetical protein DDE82_008717 [Stemphylium lycopersici]
MSRLTLITGASGLLGRQVQREFSLDGWKSIGTGLNRITLPDVIKLDILNRSELEKALDEINPSVVVHCAANRFPDSCTADPEAARALNVGSSRALAEATIARGIFLIYISTDYVFSGRPGEAPYKVDATPNPPNVISMMILSKVRLTAMISYGQTKLEGEQAVLDVANQAAAKNKVVILRVPVLYGACDEPKDSAVNVLMSQLWNAQQIDEGEPKIQADDYALRYPTNTQDVGRVCRDIAKLYLDPTNADRELPSILHFSSEDQMTKWQICQMFADIMGLPLDNMKWKPPALRAPILLLAIAICWSLIAVVQTMLSRSQRDQGIIFAPRISDLPLSRTFLYLYFPTIIAVIFSIYWAWIDLETKRMEPYYQLSKENGALGKHSILLQYPFDFLPLVPFKAAREKHWPVFWASFAVVLVTWGVVPTQAGIFSTRTVTRNVTLPFDRSMGFVPASDQASTLNLQFAQSTYGIAVLNEPLTQYMARNYTLAPFRPSLAPSSSNTSVPYGNWTAPTTMYSLDLYCEPAIMGTNLLRTGIVANSSNGCSFSLGLEGNITIGTNKAYSEGPALRNKEYTAMYVGYWNPFGFADYSLDQYCPETSNTTFYAAWERNKAKETDPVQKVTAIYCRPTYYQQEVIATVDAITLEASKVDLVGDKEPLQDGIFNTTFLETLMSSNSLSQEVRGNLLPVKSMPQYFAPVAQTNLSLSSGPSGAGILSAMAGLAFAVSDLPLEEYLDWEVLSKSYADAYRLMFARAMREVLDQDFGIVETITGERIDTTEAVLLEPVFVYIVEGLLGVVSLATMALLYLSVTRTKNLRSNPSTIAAIMSIVADNEALLADIEGLDCCKVEDIENHLGHKRYKLVDDGNSIGIIELGHSPEIVDDEAQLPPPAQRRNAITEIAKPIRPVEFSSWVAGLLVSSFVALSIILTIIFTKARVQGLPLPSTNTIVQNILENYIPTAIATLIEPVWLLFNRLLCMLQPIEELQNCDARAKDSIDRDYSSLPPQLVIFKALKSKHFVLALVCTMALLANLLAVSLAGLFNQTTIDIEHATATNPPFDFKFVSINGTVGPLGGQTFGDQRVSGAYQGGDGEEQFLVADSHLRQGTPLPPWTDDKMFYLPLFQEGINHTTKNDVEAKTNAFGAKLECNSLDFGKNFQAGLISKIPAGTVVEPSVNITISSDTGRPVQCTKTEAYMRQGPISTTEGNCVTGPSAAELVFVLGPPPNASQADADVCMGSIVMGWLRDRNGSCGAVGPRMFNEQDASFVHCRPKLLTGAATIRVDSNGRLQKEAQNVTLDDHAPRDTFSNDPINVIGQSNRYLFMTSSTGWHNDSFADGFINYFISHAANSSRLVDPTQSLPTLEDIEGPLNKAYALLFAIWIGTNKNKLFVPHEARSTPGLEGWRIEAETRLFMSTPMFAISEAILCTYAIVAIMVYMRRPGQYLARLPTSIASLIALFAASAAVLDMRGTSYLDKRGRARHLEEVDARYGYGSFIGGGDGRVHIGIEKTPFVRVRSKTTWLDRKVSSWRKGSAN